MISKEAKAYLRKQGLEMRYVIVEEHQGSQWEDVLPYETTRAWAIKKTRSNWSYLTPGEKKNEEKIIASLSLCNWGGIAVIDINEDEVTYRIFDGRKTTSKIRMDNNGHSYFMSMHTRQYIDNLCMCNI